MGITKHIIGSLGDITGEVIKETTKLPGDIAGKALESLGTASGKQGTIQSIPSKKGTEEIKAFGSFDAASEKDKKIVARAALAALAQKPKKEPSADEKRRMTEEQEKKIKKDQQEQKEKLPLPKITTKQRRGDLYGVLAKQGVERSKNVRAE